MVVRQALAIIRYLRFYITGNLVTATENRDDNCYVCMRVSSTDNSWSRDMLIILKSISNQNVK